VQGRNQDNKKHIYKFIYFGNLDDAEMQNEKARVKHKHVRPPLGAVAPAGDSDGAAALASLAVGLSEYATGARIAHSSRTSPPPRAPACAGAPAAAAAAAGRAARRRGRTGCACAGSSWRRRYLYYIYIYIHKFIISFKYRAFPLAQLGGVVRRGVFLHRQV